MASVGVASDNVLSGGGGCEVGIASGNTGGVSGTAPSSCKVGVSSQYTPGCCRNRHHVISTQCYQNERSL